MAIQDRIVLTTWPEVRLFAVLASDVEEPPPIVATLPFELSFAKSQRDADYFVSFYADEGRGLCFRCFSITGKQTILGVGSEYNQEHFLDLLIKEVWRRHLRNLSHMTRGFLERYTRIDQMVRIELCNFPERGNTREVTFSEKTSNIVLTKWEPYAISLTNTSSELLEVLVMNVGQESKEPYDYKAIVLQPSERKVAYSFYAHVGENPPDKTRETVKDAFLIFLGQSGFSDAFPKTVSNRRGVTHEPSIEDLSLSGVEWACSVLKFRTNFIQRKHLPEGFIPETSYTGTVLNFMLSQGLRGKQ